MEPETLTCPLRCATAKASSALESSGKGKTQDVTIIEVALGRRAGWPALDQRDRNASTPQSGGHCETDRTGTDYHGAWERLAAQVGCLKIN
jgi:hypothetical protein